MKKEQKTNAMRQLDAAKIPYEVLSYECDGVNFDGELVATQVGLASTCVFKTLVTKSDTGRYVVCCVPVDQKLDLKALASACGCKRAEMIAQNDILAVTGYLRGGCSPIGMKKQFETYIDASALSAPKIAVSAGLRGLQLYDPAAINCVYKSQNRQLLYAKGGMTYQRAVYKTRAIFD